MIFREFGLGNPIGQSGQSLRFYFRLLKRESETQAEGFWQCVVLADEPLPDGFP